MAPSRWPLAGCVVLLLVTIVAMPATGQSPVAVDGRIGPNEYGGQAAFDDGGFVLHWRIEGDTFYLAMEANTEGWVSIGIEPEARMQGADMLFGWVNEDGTVDAADCYATDDWGEHPPDTELGGTHDILEVSGSESSGLTVIELARPLETGDSYDRDIPTQGTMRVIWGYGSRDGYLGKHLAAGLATIDLASGASSSGASPRIWPIHAGTTGLAFICILAGALIARYGRRKRWWLKFHRALTGIGSGIGLTGIVIGWLMVGAAGTGHWRGAHAYLGAALALLLATTPTLGVVQLKIKPPTGRRLRSVHRWLGRITLALMALQMVLGTLMVLGTI
jgi:hypothetical protein